MSRRHWLSGGSRRKTNQQSQKALRRKGGGRIVALDALESRVLLSVSLGTIMPLGDSITWGTTSPAGSVLGGYRDPLYTDLTNAGYSFTFVGSTIDNASTTLTNAGEAHQEGHPGYVIQQTYNGQTSGQPGGISEGINGWISQDGQPNYTLLIIGSNDVLTNFQLSTAPQRLSDLINKIFTDAPNTHLIVGEIPPLNTGWATDALGVAYNQGVASVVASHAASGQKVSLVDLHSNIDQNADVSDDNIHANLAGYQQIASVFASALEAQAYTGPGPTPPTNLIATTTNGTSVSLSWADNSSNETGFLIERKSGINGTWSQIASVGANTVSYTDSGLSAATEYFYRVRATNGSGNSPYSDETASASPFVNVAVNGTASASGGTASAAFDGTNSTTWQLGSSSGSLTYQFASGTTQVVTQYIITRSTLTDRAPKSWQLQGSNDGTTWNALDSQTNQTFTGQIQTYNFSNTTAYSYYRLAISTNNGSGLTEIDELELMAIPSGNPTVPSAPTGLSATAASSSQINLSWTASSGATGYNLYRGTSSNGEGSTAINGGTPISGTTYSDTGLSSSTTYYYFVKAVDSAGSSGASSEASATTSAPGQPPSAPTGLAATAASSSQINLSWNSVSGATGYNIYRGTTTGGESGTALNSSPITTTSYSDTGLSASTAYYYVVKAVNSSGSSGASSEATATTQSTGGGLTNVATGGTASSPTGGNAANAFDNNAGTNWQVSTLPAYLVYQFGGGNSYAVTEYKITRDSNITDRAPKTWTLQGSSDGSTWTTVDTQTNVTFTSNTMTFDFSNSTAYSYYRLNITATAGSALLEVAELQLLASTGSTPAAPTGLSATAASSSQINLSWTASSGATGYNIYRGTSSNGEGSTAINGGTPVTTTSYSDTGLSASTTYYYFVKAVNSSGSSGASSEASATTNAAGQAPSAPTGLSASAASSSQINLTWNSVTGATGYNIYRGTTTGGESSTAVNSSPVTTTSFSDTGLSASTTYYYVVKAVNSYGSSGASSEASATTSSHTLTNVATGGTASSPTGGNAANAFDGNANTNWQVSQNNGILEYQFGGGASYAVQQYTITRDSVITDRAPKTWTFEASTDGVHWVTLDSESNVTFTSNTMTFNVSNSTAYAYYRLNITATAGSALLEVAELQLLA